MGGPKNTVCIDNSAQFRYQDNVPLCVPEINAAKLAGANYVSNPNCTTAIGAMALYPLHKKYGLKKVFMSTYQASSGAGAPGMHELESSTTAWAKDPAKVPKPEVFAHQLLFNVIPHIDKFQPNGYTKEEMKVAWEIVKIAGGPKNTVCIDNSAQFRYQKDVPLCVPEINKDAIGNATYISNPNCTTAIGAI